MAKQQQKQQPKVTVVHDGWEAYVAEGEDGLIFVSFDIQAAQEDLTKTLQKCVRVQLPIKKPNENGAPDPDEAEALRKVEDDLCNRLSQKQVVCRLVGTLTQSGQRELVFQLDDERAFANVLMEWQSANPQYQAELERHDGWEFFNDVVAPSTEEWIAIGDRQVVDQLIEAGSDPEQPHALEYLFHGAPEALGAVAKELEERGYEIRASEDAPDQLICVVQLPLDLDEIVDHTIANIELAEQHAVQCDGWSAAVVGGEPAAQA